MATVVMVPVEVPDEILAKYDVVAVRRPRNDLVLLEDCYETLCAMKCSYSNQPHIILRPKIQWPEWFKMRWVSRAKGGEWNRHPVKPERCHETWGWSGNI